MRRIVFTVILLFACNFGFSQYSDAKLKEMETKIEQQGKYIENLNKNMRSHAREYKAGTTLIIFGTIATVGGSFIALNQQESAAIGLIGTGFILSSIGTILQWHSNRWFKYGNQTQEEWETQIINEYQSRRGAEN